MLKHVGADDVIEPVFKFRPLVFAQLIEVEDDDLAVGAGGHGDVGLRTVVFHSGHGAMLLFVQGFAEIPAGASDVEYRGVLGYELIKLTERTSFAIGLHLVPMIHGFPPCCRFVDQLQVIYI